MCTLTLVLPLRPPIENLGDRIEPLTAVRSPRQVWLNDRYLVYFNDGWYFRFAWQSRELVLDGVSDFNPLACCRRQMPLNTALARVAMTEVEKLTLERKNYPVAASLGSALLKALRAGQGTRFCVSPWALWNYYNSHRLSNRDCFRRLVTLAENALLAPAKVLQVTGNQQQQVMSVLVEDRDGSGFKCRLSPARLQITRAAPRNNFTIHAFSNNKIHITEHCLQRFQSRIVDGSRCPNPLLARSQLLKFIKNRPVHNSYRLGKTVFLNIAGSIFIGALSADCLNLLTVYQETRLDIGQFQQNLLLALRGEEIPSH